MITKEQIETRIANNKAGIAELEGHETNHMQRELVVGWKEDNEIYALAQQALAMQRRPIAELDLFGIDDDDVFLVWSKTGRPELRTFSFERGDDPSSEYSTFVPLSSLTKATP
jgi:hypothetical protein